MSLAETYKAKLRAPANRQAAKAKLKASAISVQKRGDDNIYTMPDFSRLLHRVLVDEYHVFDNRVTEITEDMARVAIMKFPRLVSKMQLMPADIIVYDHVLGVCNVSSSCISGLTGIHVGAVSRSLKKLSDLGYISRVKAKGGAYIYSSIL